jgi:MOSC domain-containing protein YiiM
MPALVLELHRKPEVEGEHGLPKPKVPEIEVTERGVTGDFNRYRHEEAKDDPTSAVLVMPVETLEELQREGWPVRSGDLGENITTRGMAYAAFRPGLRIETGSAHLEVTRPCDPCNNLYLLPYVGPERGPQFLKVMLGRRGWYCRVVRAGRIRTGDLFVAAGA